MSETLSVATRKAITPVFMILDNETILPASPEEVWPTLLDYPTWQNYSEVRRISGVIGEVDEVVALIKKEKGFVFPPYYARTLKIDPPRRIVWRTFIDKGADPIDRSGIVDFRLYPCAEGSRFCTHLYYEYLVPHDTEEELVAFRASQEVNFRTLQAATRPKLLALIEARLGKPSASQPTAA